MKSGDKFLEELRLATEETRSKTRQLLAPPVASPVEPCLLSLIEYNPDWLYLMEYGKAERN